MSLPEGRGNDDFESRVPDLSAHLNPDYPLSLRGGYSDVHQSSYKGKPVAVKVFRAFDGASLVSIRQIQLARAIWSTLDHPNIIPLWGFVENDESRMPYGALVSPWCANGDSETYLKERGEFMVLGERFKLLYGAIEGAVYLHQRDPPIIHGDIKPANILIDQDGVPKLCDFGLSRIFLLERNSGHTATTPHVGTARYLAPELVESDDITFSTRESDVYAMGCVGLRFLFLTLPYKYRHHNEYGHITRDIRVGIPPAREFPGITGNLQDTLSIILKETWQKQPSCRPTMPGFPSMLRHVQESNQSELKPQGNDNIFDSGPQLRSTEQMGTAREASVTFMGFGEGNSTRHHRSTSQGGTPHGPMPSLRNIWRSLLDSITTRPVVNAMFDTNLAGKPSASSASSQGSRPQKRQRDEDEEDAKSPRRTRRGSGWFTATPSTSGFAPEPAPKVRIDPKGFYNRRGDQLLGDGIVIYQKRDDKYAAEFALFPEVEKNIAILKAFSSMNKVNCHFHEGY
ncbi:kinase-like protein [Serendipita vermifera]|nr:kinase-like protein [Serendipita vermifera]